MTKAEAARQKQNERMQAELERVRQMRRFEEEAVRKAGGTGPVCGVDEAGRGPLAGPVAAAAVILPEDLELAWLNDSKKVTEKRRKLLCAQIQEKALAWAVVMVPPERIDEINILQATYEAMRSAVRQLTVRPGVLVNDAVLIPGLDLLQVPVIKGDAKCISVAAASILAKVTRDAYMEKMDALYPEYGFAGHKGYGTKAHCAAILEHGPCPIHRRSFLGKLLAGQQSGSGFSVPEPAPGQNRRACGQQGEDMAADYLTRRGVRILARNFRDRDGEIDLVGEQDGTILFIEVKYRRDDRYGSPAEAVTTGKQKSICRTALYYLHLHHCPEQQPARFDVVSISGKDVQWLRNAFPFVR